MHKTIYTISLILAAHLLLLFLPATKANAGNDVTSKVYLFGFAASFNDSTVYITDIQELQDIKLQAKTNFLPNRSHYSYQLADYLKQQGATTPTCITSYSKDRAKLEKKLAKIKKKYSQQKNIIYNIKTISQQEFTYKPADDSHATTYSTPDGKTARKRGNRK